MVDTALVLDAVGEPNRRRLLQLLHRREESTVSELVEASGLRQPQVSKHLKVLVGADLVEVSPPFDQAGGTAYLGVSIMFEMLCVMARCISK